MDGPALREQIECCQSLLGTISAVSGKQHDALALTRNAADLLTELASEANMGGMQRPQSADDAPLSADAPFHSAATAAELARAAACEGLDSAADAHAAASKAEWKEWVTKNLDAGAPHAHKFLRLPELWRPTTVTTPDGVVTADPMSLLDGHKRKLSKVWDARDVDGEAMQGGARSNAAPPWHDEPPEALARPDIDELRQASRTFKHETLTTYDGIAMRHYDLLSDIALDIVSDFILILELTGALPPQLRLTTMPLIPKARGGHRAIAAFPSLYRLWSRVRRDIVRQWEAMNDRAFVAAGTGRGPQDVVWRQAARCEAAAEQGGAAATLLWDLTSFFEAVQRVPLWFRARRLGFPAVILRVALSAYEGPRMLTMAGALSKAVVARHGVPAGCGLAMALTRAYTLHAYDRVARALTELPAASACLDVYVDDLAVTVTGARGQIVDSMCAARDLLIEEVHGSLHCDIELSKAAVVASTQPITNELARRFGDMAGPQCSRRRRTAAANLGIDFAAGRRRKALAGGGMRRKRMRTLWQKARRLARIRSLLGRRATSVFVAGPLAGAEYGAAVNGFTDAEVGKLRRAAAQALTPRARGRSLNRTLLIAGVPTWRAEVEVILQYARQVWEATVRGPRECLNGALTLADIDRLWHAACSDAVFAQGTGKRQWHMARGPIAAMRLTLDRVGWSMKSPFTLVDGHGVEIVLTMTAPALLASLLRQAVITALERQVAASIAADDATFEGRRVAVEHVQAQLARDRKLGRADVAAYKAVSCGAVMTFQRAARLGYLVEDRCPLCGAAGDSIRHRIWRCTHPDAVAARCSVAPAWLQREEAAAADSASFWTTGWFPHPADTWPRPAAAPTPIVTYGELPQGDPSSLDTPWNGMHGLLYVDGSCTTGVFAELRRAGAAVVQRAHGETVVARVRYPLPAPFPQTPQAAEYVALGLSQQLLRAGCTADVASDCLNVVRDATGPYQRAVHARRMHAAIVRAVRSDLNWARNATVRKVKAHAIPGSLPQGGAREDAVGNDWADREAKAAVDLHPKPSPEMEAELEAMLRRAWLVVRTIAKVTQAFPPMPKERMRRPPPSTEGATLVTPSGHHWQYASGLWRCTQCLRMTLAPSLDRRLAMQQCEGDKASMHVDAIASRGHVLATTGAEMPLLFCIRCGAWAMRRAYGLAAPCRGTPSPSGAQALACIRRGRQPWINPREAELPRRSLGATPRRTRLAPDGGAGEGTAAKKPRRHDRAPGDADDEEMCMDDLASHGDLTAIHDHGAAPPPDTHWPEEDEDVFGHGGGLDELAVPSLAAITAPGGPAGRPAAGGAALAAPIAVHLADAGADSGSLQPPAKRARSGADVRSQTDAGDAPHAHAPQPAAVEAPSGAAARPETWTRSAQERDYRIESSQGLPSQRESGGRAAAGRPEAHAEELAAPYSVQLVDAAAASSDVQPPAKRTRRGAAAPLASTDAGERRPVEHRPAAITTAAAKRRVAARETARAAVADHCAIARSIQNHEDAVKRRRLSSAADPPAVAAAERMAAVRQRVAERCTGTASAALLGSGRNADAVDDRERRALEGEGAAECAGRR